MKRQEQVAAELANILKDVPTDKLDEALALIKSCRTKEAQEARKQEFKQLFEIQIQALKDRGCPEQIVELLANQKAAVLEKASRTVAGKGNIPFLPVIPRTYRSPYDLMAMVRHDGKQGYTHLNPTVITDKVETPKEPYYIFDVEDGEATLKKSPEQVERKSRSPHTAAEVMALCVHTNVLSKHYVWAAGSRFDSSAWVPYVCLGDDGPWLGWGCAGSFERWGSPSCGSRGL